MADPMRHMTSAGQIRITITHIENGTFIARIINQNNHSVDAGYTTRDIDNYDDQGALIYVCAVIFIYGFSIILMIGSSMKKTSTDQGVSKYMNNIKKLRRLERRQEKFKTRLAMSKKRIQNVLGSGKSVNSQSSNIHCDISSVNSESSFYMEPLDNSVLSVVTEEEQVEPLMKNRSNFTYDDDNINDQNVDDNNVLDSSDDNLLSDSILMTYSQDLTVNSDYNEHYTSGHINYDQVTSDTCSPVYASVKTPEKTVDASLVQLKTLMESDEEVTFV